MHKKISMVCMALAALALLAVASSASASPVLTSEGKAVAPGSSTLDTNTGEAKFTGGFAVSCTNVAIKGTITSNSGTAIKGEAPVGNVTMSGDGPSTDCTAALGAVRVTVNSKLCGEAAGGTDTFNFTGCGANITFTIEVTGTGACKYSAASMSSSFVTNTDLAVTMLEQSAKKEEGGIFCPSEGKVDVTLDGTTTEGGTLSVS